MAMNYTSLVADKNTAGSIASWVRYSKLDINQIVDEAQALLYSLLRTREMRTIFSFNMPVGGSAVALPTGFLDPIGRMYAPSLNLTFRHKDENFILRNRVFTETTGTLGNNPFTTTSGSTTVAVSLSSHGFSQESEINFAGATAVDGITPNGTFNITSITDANNFVIDTLTQVASSSTTGGGSVTTYTCDILQQGSPYSWAIWDETIHFDFAFNQAMNCQLQYFRSLPLLSSSNLTNFLTTRYPQLLRTACVAQAADFMKDDSEYQKGLTRLTALIQTTAAEADMMYRGAEIDTETP